jgi:RimJ/RimL family protein N-acetyltransferase
MPHPVSFADKPTLAGELVLLRPVTEADAAGLFAIDAEAVRLTGTQDIATMADLARWYATRADHTDRLDLAIVDRKTGTWAGEVVLNNLDAANRSCGFRILLGSDGVRDRGLGTEATRLVLAYAFEQVGVHRVELEVYDFNPRARHVYTRVGFVHEGTKRKALYSHGQWVDTHMMAMLASDWVIHGGSPAGPDGTRVGQPLSDDVNEVAGT